jgi:hypothetical protein
MAIMNLQREEIDGVQVVTDGLHKYWKDEARIRWALRAWPDDGLGVRGHGAAASLEEAQADALACHKIRLMATAER